MYIRYATRDSKICTLKMLAVSVVALLVTIPLSYFLSHFGNRLEVVGKICTVSSLVVFISPLWDIASTNVSENPRFVSVRGVIFTSTILWTYCGSLESNAPIIVINAIGGILESVYITMYICYATRDSMIRTFKMLASSVVALLACTTSSLLMFISPVFDIVRVVKTRNVEPHVLLAVAGHDCQRSCLGSPQHARVLKHPITGEVFVSGLFELWPKLITPLMCLFTPHVLVFSRLTFKKIPSEISVGSHGSLKYVLIFTSTVLWTYYGSLEVNWAIIVIKTIGDILKSVYITMYIRYATRGSKIRTLKMLAVSVTALLVTIPLSYFLSHFGNRLEVVGKICTVSSLVVFISPLWDIVKISRVPRFVSVRGVIFTSTILLWTYYGSLESNAPIIVINAIGGILESVYITMYICYATKDSKIRTLKMLAVIVVALLVTIPLSYFLSHFGNRLEVVCKICTVSFLVVFISPLWNIYGLLKPVMWSTHVLLAVAGLDCQRSCVVCVRCYYTRLQCCGFKRFWIITGLRPDRGILRYPRSSV
ncbi:hypothetical protein CASFOL_027148 [Castilleja foliolosa]|uniref:Uncharacterized protein n=1 Tax=Castilleja foliolosa TaxID=1961234 RepID=A0ABD3CF20_9LAMI